MGEVWMVGKDEGIVELMRLVRVLLRSLGEGGRSHKEESGIEFSHSIHDGRGSDQDAY